MLYYTTIIYLLHFILRLNALPSGARNLNSLNSELAAALDSSADDLRLRNSTHSSFSSIVSFNSKSSGLIGTYLHESLEDHEPMSIESYRLSVGYLTPEDTGPYYSLSFNYTAILRSAFLAHFSNTPIQPQIFNYLSANFKALLQSQQSQDLHYDKLNSLLSSDEFLIYTKNLTFAITAFAKRSFLSDYVSLNYHKTSDAFTVNFFIDIPTKPFDLCLLPSTKSGYCLELNVPEALAQDIEEITNTDITVLTRTIIYQYVSQTFVSLIPSLNTKVFSAMFTKGRQAMAAVPYFMQNGKSLITGPELLASLQDVDINGELIFNGNSALPSYEADYPSCIYFWLALGSSQKTKLVTVSSTDLNILFCDCFKSVADSLSLNENLPDANTLHALLNVYGKRSFAPAKQVIYELVKYSPIYASVYTTYVVARVKPSYISFALKPSIPDFKAEQMLKNFLGYATNLVSTFKLLVLRYFKQSLLEASAVILNSTSLFEEAYKFLKASSDAACNSKYSSIELPIGNQWTPEQADSLKVIESDYANLDQVFDAFSKSTTAPGPFRKLTYLQNGFQNCV